MIFVYGKPRNSPPFLHMPLDFKGLQGVGIKPELIALTGADATPASREGPEEVQVGGDTHYVAYQPFQ